MTMSTSPRTRALTLLAGLLVGLVGFFLIPAGAADAHAALISTNPVAGSILPAGQAPSVVIITFSEHVQPEAAKISVIGPDRKKIDVGPPTSVGDELRIPVRSDVENGTYLVSYRVISADSHPVASGFYYSIGAPSAGGAPAPLASNATDPVVSTAVSIMQFLGFAGLCLIVGPALVLIALWPRRLDRTGPTRLAYTGIGLVGFAALAGLYLQAPYASGNGLFDVSGADISSVLDTTYGRSIMVRLAALVVCTLLLRPVLAGRSVKSDRILLGAIGLIGIATWPFEGHPAASSVPPLTIIADAAHLVSVSIWIGGLVMLVAFLLRRANARELGAILPVWSNWATLAITVLVLGGTAQALIEIGSIHALLYTTYGQLVLVKVGILIVIIAFAAGARKLVQKHAVVSEIAIVANADLKVPVAVGAGSRSYVNSTVDDAAEQHGSAEPGGDTGTGTDEANDRGHGGGDAHDRAENESDDESNGDEEYDHEGEEDFDEEDDGAEPEPTGMFEPQVKRLRRSVLIELALAVCVLVATSILVQSSPALNAAGVNANGGGTISLTSTPPLYTLQVDFEANAAGGTDIHMFFFNSAGGPQPVQALTVVATLPSQSLTTDLGVTKVADSHWTSTAILPVSGVWTFTFTVQTSPTDAATVHTTQNIN